MLHRALAMAFIATVVAAAPAAADGPSDPDLNPLPATVTSVPVAVSGSPSAFTAGSVDVLQRPDLRRAEEDPECVPDGAEPDRRTGSPPARHAPDRGLERLRAEGRDGLRAHALGHPVPQGRAPARRGGLARGFEVPSPPHQSAAGVPTPVSADDVACAPSRPVPAGVRWRWRAGQRTFVRDPRGTR